MAIPNGNSTATRDVEDPVSLLDYLFCLGIHLSCHSRRRPRSSAVALCRDALPRCGTCSLWLDDRPRRALSHRTPMDLGILTCRPDFRSRLRIIVLGRAARAVGHRRGDVGYYPGLHVVVGG